MGKHVVVLGSQWGDEGKGKIVDMLMEQASAAVRFQGGHNAGHTLMIDGQKNGLTFNSIRYFARPRAMPHW